MKADFLSESWRPEKGDFFFKCWEEKPKYNFYVWQKYPSGMKKKNTPHPKKLVISRPILKEEVKKILQTGRKW